MNNTPIEKKLTREKFEEIMRSSLANHMADASKEELDGLYESFIKLIKVLKEDPIDQSNEILDEDEEENEDFSRCEQCGENAWDGYICHSCGLKII